MVIEVQKDDHFALNYVDNHPIANVGAHHASQVMTKRLTDEWVIADLGFHGPCAGSDHDFMVKG